MIASISSIPAHSEISNNTSSSGKSKMSYTACDFGLLIVQRLLISITILFGYNIISAPGDIPQNFFLHAVLRIIRNFFYITKGIRKWMAINYNDGIIPTPPLPCGRVSYVSRSTPRESRLDNGSRFNSDSLDHSPIERRFSEPAGKYDLATALKEHRNRSAGMQPIYRYPDFSNSSDFFGQSSSSRSLIFLLNSLAKSFVSYIQDPDEEMNQMMELASKGIIQAKENAQNGTTVESVTDSRRVNLENTQNGTMTESITDSQLNSIEAENRRRANLVVESVLEHDEEQRKANSSDGSHELEPLPIPNFDASGNSGAAIEEIDQQEKTPQQKMVSQNWYSQAKNTRQWRPCNKNFQLS